ncbi:HIT-like domain-containing protein [Cyathus striatus]|nr:HIT-like domain-containing protein [Cyathus striatus]
MSHPSAPKSFSALNTFKFERILNDDPLSHSLIILGTFATSEGNERVQAVVRIEKTALHPSEAPQFFGENGLIKKVEFGNSTDIYTWFFAWLGEERERDVKINIVCPATDVHIRKYTKQEQLIVRESPELYEKIVKPYILAFPPSRTQWVENILTGISEQDKILVTTPDFLILPDMKWDLKNVTSLYLVALVQDRSIRSIRDLRKKHLHLLKDIRREAEKVVKERWGLGKGSLTMYIHYQPSYYHFHVHIVNANYHGAMLGMTVGQAHLLTTSSLISTWTLKPALGSTNA